jgi:exopolysaccharide biosynthesis polyprenyl glycosylphosphotransferase
VELREIEARARPAGPLARFGWVREPSGGLSARLRRGVWQDALLRRMLALADVGAGIAAAVVIGLIRGLDVGFWALVFLPLWPLLAKLHGLYDRDQRSLRHLTVDELPTIFVWAMSATGATVVALMVTPTGTLDVSVALRVWLGASAAGFLLRAVARVSWRWMTPPERTLIVGDGPLSQETKRKLQLFPDTHVELVAEREHIAATHLDDGDEMTAWAFDVDRIILASEAIDEGVIAALVAFCRREQIKLSVIPPMRGMFGTAVLLTHVADLPVVEYNTWAPSRSTTVLKRALDVAVSAGLLVVLSPLFALIALAVKLDGRGPVLFTQLRAGYNGVAFRMFKFRTMVANAEDLLSDLVRFEDLRDPMFKLANDPRVTKLGRFLRRTSLDELPQLFNVLRGDMSLVGPRPEQVELVTRYRPEHRFRLSVKPGITGPMQVFGRGELAFEERLAVEREYIENLSVARDLRILAMTVVPVISGRGAF